MGRRVLDTSVLIRYWAYRVGRWHGPITAATVVSWAEDLVSLKLTNAVVTPVVIEFLAGARSSQELELFDHFLSRFAVIDGGVVMREDWLEATKKVRRVPRDGKPRQLGDVLIRAISQRLNHEVDSVDSGFPR